MKNHMKSPFNCTVRQTAGFPLYPSGRKHSGEDYVPVNKSIEKNWYIYAPFDGKIKFYANHSVYGNYITITSLDGVYKVLLAHLEVFSSSFHKTSGICYSGQFVGVAGSTGNSTGRHLHIELRRNNVLVPASSFIDFIRSDVKMWKNGSTPERMYLCAEHAWYQYDDVHHISLSPRKEGTCIKVVPLSEGNVYMIEVSLGTGTCVGYVKYKGGV